MNAPIASPSQSASHTGRALVRSLERRRLRIYLALLVLDILLIAVAFALCGALYLSFRPFDAALLQAQLLLPLYLTLALYQQAYSMRSLQDWRFAATRALGALLLAATLLLFITFYTKSTASFSRVLFTGGIVASAVLIVASRWLLGHLIGRVWGRRVVNVLHIDAGGTPVTLDDAIRIDAGALGIVPDLDDPEALHPRGGLPAQHGPRGGELPR